MLLFNEFVILSSCTTGDVSRSLLIPLLGLYRISILIYYLSVPQTNPPGQIIESHQSKFYFFFLFFFPFLPSPLHHPTTDHGRKKKKAQNKNSNPILQKRFPKAFRTLPPPSSPKKKGGETNRIFEAKSSPFFFLSFLFFPFFFSSSNPQESSISMGRGRGGLYVWLYVCI